LVVAAILLFFNLVWLLVNSYNFYPPAVNRFKKKEKLVWREMEAHPLISVLLPAYHEKNTLAKTVEKIFEADYPKEKLELIIINETDDKETQEVVRGLQKRWPKLKQVIGDSTQGPPGKPRALNWGLKEAKGEIVGVIDAEDLIEPLLFKKVAYWIKERGYSACQGILDMVNERDGWRNLQFRAEYGWWFRFQLPNFAKAGFPVPLGGTTNFIRKEIIEEMGGWDEWNLTEDFELGLRLYFQDKKVAIIPSITQEESPLGWQCWLKQRTRWQRGKIQTLKKFIRPGGFKNFFHLLVISIWPHLGIVNLIGIGLGIFAFLTHPQVWSWLFPIFYINLAAIFTYLGLSAVGYWKTQRRMNFSNFFRGILIAITLPFYWFCQWIADLRAIKQEYIERRFYWEKTDHIGRHYN